MVSTLCFLLLSERTFHQKFNSLVQILLLSHRRDSAALSRHSQAVVNDGTDKEECPVIVCGTLLSCTSVLLSNQRHKHDQKRRTLSKLLISGTF